MDKYLLLLFDRPNEPVFVPKGEQKVIFDIPTNYLVGRYQSLAQRILNYFTNESKSSIPIKRIPIPDLSVPSRLGRRDNFSLFIPAHRKMAAYLTELFLGARTVEDLLSLAAYCHDRINSQLFVYALSVAILHRADTKHLSIPSLAEIFPDKFFDSGVFSRAIEEAHVVLAGSRMPIEIPLDWTATDVDPEHRVAYFREDVGLNLHHWHWHLVYPFEGPMIAVKKDRRGELFYYFHHQLIARYDIERLCNGLPRVKHLTNLREPIPEAYFPKMDQTVAGRAWPGRPDNMLLFDIDRPADQLKFTLSDLERWRDRVVSATQTRQVYTRSGQIVQLDDFSGIDILGNMIEASVLSPDQSVYGDLHNLGHVAISFAHDPDHRYLVLTFSPESYAVMGDATTAMRDPIFYRWHAFIDDIFIRFKDSLPAYNVQQLSFPGITVQEVKITTPGGNPNTLSTHWTKSDVDLSRGLDFAPRGSVLVRVQHLNHDAFSYTFVVNNSGNREVTGTVRVFLAPRFDEAGRQLSANEQRKLMIEMDKFTAALKKGQNVIQRNSVESSVTIPFEATFRNVDKHRPDPNNLHAYDRFNFCGCGWPQHMLVPKGTAQGFAMDLFVMVTNYEVDRIKQADPTGCRNGIAFCGLRDLKYPDARSMGFPFDRVVRTGVNRMSDFVLPNMKLQQITVRFNNVVKPRQK